MKNINPQIEQLNQLIDSHHHIVALTGAGISTSAGINDLMHMPMGSGSLLSSESSLEADPVSFYKELHKTFLDQIFQNGPTIAHKALANLEKSGHLDAVVTTNVDYLHEIAGNTKVADIWYSFNQNYCLKCGHEFSIDILNQSGVPYCPICGGLISPGPTHHHIGTSRTDIENAVTWMNDADMVIVIGSNGYYDRVKGNVPLVQINPLKTEFDQEATLNIRENADDVLREFA